MIAAIGDLHISCKSDKEFEITRITALIKHLQDEHAHKKYTLVLLGDVFDSNSPSLEDIKLFYSFIEQLQDTFPIIRIICGNHDYKVFDYLPQVGYTYFNSIEEVNGVVYVPWTKLDEHISAIGPNTKYKGKLLLSHARCTIEPHIVEEVNIKTLADKYKLVVLGDIHMPYSPYENVHYTSEPTQHSYKQYQMRTTGYIVINKDLSFTRVETNLPYKCKLAPCAYKDLDRLISALNPKNRYKVIVKDTISNLQKIKKLSYKHIKFEVVPVVVFDETKQAEALKDMVSGKISIEQLLFDYVSENYSFLPETSSKILRAIK